MKIVVHSSGKFAFAAELRWHDCAVHHGHHKDPHCEPAKSEFDFRLDYIGTVAGIQMLLPKQLATDVHRNYDLLWQP